MLKLPLKLELKGTKPATSGLGVDLHVYLFLLEKEWNSYHTYF